MPNIISAFHFLTDLPYDIGHMTVAYDPINYCNPVNKPLFLQHWVSP